MNSLKKICDGKPSIALRAMVTGLRKDSLREGYEIDMDTFGDFDQGMCFGCAATSTLQELINKRFRDNQIRFALNRATFLELDPDEMSRFESAINYARVGELYRLFKFMGKTYQDQYEDRFYLNSSNWQEKLSLVEDLITELEAQGL